MILHNGGFHWKIVPFSSIVCQNKEDGHRRRRKPVKKYTHYPPCNYVFSKTLIKYNIFQRNYESVLTYFIANY